MAVEITTQGWIEVWRDGVFVSRHTVETKAVESALAHADEHGDGTYQLRFPGKTLVSRLVKRISAISWNGSPTAAWTSGQNGAPVNLANFLRNDQNKIVTYTATGLPAGVTLTGSQLAYNATAPASSAVVTFSATYTGFTVMTTGTVTISVSQTNQPPSWTVPDGYQIPTTPGAVVNLGQWITDPEGDPWVTTLTSSTPNGVSVSADGLATMPAAGTYSVVVGLDTASSVAQVTGLAIISSVSAYSYVTLSWSAATGATSYQVERSLNNATWTQVGANITSLSYSDGTVAPSTPYYYRVRGVDATSQGVYSETRTRTTAAAPAVGQRNWVERSTHPSVVWAHDFTESTEVDMFQGSSFDWAKPGWELSGDNVARQTQSTTHCNWVANDPVINRPCVQMRHPAMPPAIPVANITRSVPARVTTTIPHGLNPALYTLNYWSPHRTVFFQNVQADWDNRLLNYCPINSSSGVYGFNGYSGGSRFENQMAAVVIDEYTIDLYSFFYSTDGNQRIDTTIAPTPYSGGATIRPFVNSASSWLRPLSALPARYFNNTLGVWCGNGKSTPDPAANGTLPRRDSGDLIFQHVGAAPAVRRVGKTWLSGYYGNPTYAANARTWWTRDKYASTGGYAQGTNGVPDAYDGHDFWVQYRTKWGAGRWDPKNNISAGKTVWILYTSSTPDHEIVVMDIPKGTGSGGGTANLVGPSYRIYTRQDSFWQFDSGTAWEYRPEEWVTFLMHVIPGTSLNYDTSIAIWAARQGETSYTLIHRASGLRWTFDGNENNAQIPATDSATFHPKGCYNVFELATFHNGSPNFSDMDMLFSFTDIIFAKGSGSGDINEPPLIPAPTD